MKRLLASLAVCCFALALAAASAAARQEGQSASHRANPAHPTHPAHPAHPAHPTHPATPNFHSAKARGSAASAADASGPLPGASDGNPGLGLGRTKVTLCHVPPGNPSNGHEITVGAPAVQAHMGNHDGDTFGACPAAASAPDGRVGAAAAIRAAGAIVAGTVAALRGDGGAFAALAALASGVSPGKAPRDGVAAADDARLAAAGTDGRKADAGNGKGLGWLPFTGLALAALAGIGVAMMLSGRLSGTLGGSASPSTSRIAASLRGGRLRT